METKVTSQKLLKQRKFLMVLPLLTMPFLAILFISLGGGKNGEQESNESEGSQGLNMKLPDANFKKGKDKDKLGLYEEIAKDAERMRATMKSDPYYKSDSNLTENGQHETKELQSLFQRSATAFNQGDFGNEQKTSPSLRNAGTDPNEQKIIERLTQLKAVLNKKPDPAIADYHSDNNHNSSPDMEKLQRLMVSMNQNSRVQSDPELDRINGMLDKVMYIQHPEKLEDSLNAVKLKNKPPVFAAHLDNDEPTFKSNQKGFYEIGIEKVEEAARVKDIEAVIEEKQKLLTGSRVRIRLLEDVYVHGIRVPKDQWVYGNGAFANERFKITINSIRIDAKTLPVSLEVYDMDGMQGIYIPGNIIRDVSKESTDEAINSVGLTALDPSLGAQAASAGIQAAKTLASRKIKVIQGNLPPAYKVLLKDISQK